ncbi:hypothetical protein, partial [Myroides marinus]|uniref:hypothetical protein n=1 Tax=Myroides marinus TaxID=703342 RepID=UPI002576357C
MRVSRDVVFDEMSSWYAPAQVAKDADVRSAEAVPRVQQQSQELSGPRESSSSGSIGNPWSGR